MDRNQDCADKETAAKKANLAEYLQQRIEQSQTNFAGAVGYAEPARASLNDRINAQLSRAVNEARHVERLYELQHLLQKHPEVARILDLMDVTRA